MNLLLILLISLSHADLDLAQLEGKTFHYKGPNCFGVALYAAGINPVIRGVDVTEFNAVLKHQCQKVEEPKRGDLGVYSVKNFDVIHAFYHYGGDMVLEKTGVDYLEQTPIYIRDYHKSYHTFGYSRECIRYGGKDNPVCYNNIDYYRCEDLEAVMPPQISAIEIQIDTIYEEILGEKQDNLSEYKLKLGDLINEYEAMIEQYGSEFDEILRTRLKSYQLQLKFL